MALRQTPLKRFINVNCSGELIRSICRTRRRAAASSPSLPPSQLKPATRAARITASFRPPSWWRLRFLRPATACSPDERSEIRERDTSLDAGPGFRWRSSGLRPETGHGFKVRAATTLIEASYDLAGRDGASRRNVLPHVGALLGFSICHVRCAFTVGHSPATIL